jgi:kojibiose phosphorylase
MNHNYELIDGWKIRETKWVPDSETAAATVFALANGYMGSRGAFEEADPTKPGIVGNYINGIYDTPLGKLTEREIVNVPDWHHITLDVDGERFDMRSGEVLEYSRELDMREAVLRRHVRWKSPSGKVVTIDTERFLSIVRSNVACLRYTIRPETPCTLSVEAGIESGVNNRWADHIVRFRGVAFNRGLACVVETGDPGYEVGVAVAIAGTGLPWGRTRLEADRVSRVVEGFRVRPGRRVDITLAAGVSDSRFGVGQPGRNSRESAAWAIEDGYDALKAEHIARWAELWEQADVTIEGDDAAQLGIRFSLFHLLAAAPWHSDRVSVPARGLQGQDYYGSIFWDCEMYVQPLLTATHPEAAKNCIGYRYHTLNGARRKANNYGFEGAFYAWQSQETGDDQCALYVFNNPFTGRPMRAPFSDQQVHISADIVWALQEYLMATGDWETVRTRGLPIALEVARFFASRCEKDADGSWHLRGVLGPDEYHEAVTDDAFTNAIVREAVATAIEWWESEDAETGRRGAAGTERYGDAETVFSSPTGGGREGASSKTLPRPLPQGGETGSPLPEGEGSRNPPPPQRGGGAGGGGLNARVIPTEDELAAWRDLRDNLYIPQPGPNGVIEQCEGYFGLEDASKEEVKSRIPVPGMYPGGPLGPYQSTQVIKQADVVLMLYLLRDRFTADIKRANWEYYEPRTSHDSSLSAMAYALVAADLGLADWAYPYFIRTSHIDLTGDGPHWNHGIHAAGLGGAWQAVTQGFCQLSRREDALVIRAFPVLPDQWKEVRFRYIHLGQRVEVEVTPEVMTLRHLGGATLPDADLPVEYAGTMKTLRVGETLELGRRPDEPMNR